MTGQLSWARDGETLALRGELDQDLLVPLWDARAQATDGVSAIDLSAVTRGTGAIGAFYRADSSAGSGSEIDR